MPLDVIPPNPGVVIPAKAGIHFAFPIGSRMDSRFRGNDGRGRRGNDDRSRAGFGHRRDGLKAFRPQDEKQANP
jgi:hypothetical protein